MSKFGESVDAYIAAMRQQADPHEVCGDDVDEADKLVVEAMPDGYGEAEYEAEHGEPES